MLFDEPFRVGDGLAAGLGRGRLAGASFDHPFWGVRAPADSALDLRATAAAYRAWMAPHAVFSHATAAQLWDIPIPRNLERIRPLHVSVSREYRPPEGRSISGHHPYLDDADVRRLGDLRLTSLERTVLDMSALVPDEDLLGMLDNILWRKRPFACRATESSIRVAVGRWTGRRGRTRVLSLLPLASGRADSAPESAFRLRFLRAGLPLCLPNREVFDGRGRFVALPDLQFPHFTTAIDYEGDHHRTDALQWRKDLRRAPLLEDAGWLYIRLSADDLADSAFVLQRIRRLLIGRGWAG